MRIVGKDLIMLITVTSVLLFGLVLTVYNTHRHWQEIVERPQAAPGKPLGLKHQLRNEQEKLDQLLEESQRLKIELATEESAYRQQLQKLETRRVEMITESHRMETELAERGQQFRELTKLVGDEHQNLANVDAQVLKLRQDIRAIQQTRDQQLGRVVSVSEEIYEKVGQIERLEERRRQLDRQLAQIRAK